MKNLSHKKQKNNGASYNKKRLMRIFRLSSRFQKKVLLRHFDDKAKVKEWIRQATRDFEQLIPQLPYLGGKENIFTRFLVSASMLLPLAKVLKAENVPTRTIGQIIFELAEMGYNMTPKPLRKRQGKKYFKKDYMQSWRLAAAQTQQKLYPGDWVCEFVEGDGETFQYGLTMTECGLLKFWQSQGAEELVPYLCLCDWALWKAQGVEVSRTQTLANGGEYCDYHYIRNGKNCPRGWPPESMPEWTGKYEK